MIIIFYLLCPFLLTRSSNDNNRGKSGDAPIEQQQQSPRDGVGKVRRMDTDGGEFVKIKKKYRSTQTHGTSKQFAAGYQPIRHWRICTEILCNTQARVVPTTRALQGNAAVVQGTTAKFWVWWFKDVRISHTPVCLSVGFDQQAIDYVEQGSIQRRTQVL